MKGLTSTGISSNELTSSVLPGPPTGIFTGTTVANPWAMTKEAKRNEELVLLLQTLHPEIWRGLDDMLKARDAMLGGA